MPGSIFALQLCFDQMPEWTLSGRTGPASRTSRKGRRVRAHEKRLIEPQGSQGLRPRHLCHFHHASAYRWPEVLDTPITRRLAA